jgi:hypothetical protein
MNRRHATTLAAAIALLASLAAAQAQPFRERRDQPAWGQEVRRPDPRQRRSPDLYSRVPGTHGAITATTPNQWGNLGGPGTGGGGGGSP